MKNPNTTEFWNTEFKKEYEVVTGIRKMGYHRWKPAFFEEVSKHIPLTDDGSILKVLDVACGLGHFCRYLKAKYPRVEIVGTDFSDFAVEKTQEMGSIAYTSDCYVLSKRYKNEYDFVVATELIEHLSHPKKFLKELHKILKPGGKVILSTPIKGCYVKADDHIREYTMEEFNKEVNRVFSNVQIHDLRNKGIGGFQLAVAKKI